MGKRKFPGSTAAYVQLWGGVMQVPSALVTDIVTIRISAPTVAAYTNQHETGRAVFATHPDGPLLDSLPGNVFEKGRAGDLARAAHGVFPIRYSDLPAAGTLASLVGYATVLGNTLFLFVMDSAVQGNLPPLAGDSSGIGRNAFTETVIEAAMALYRNGSPKLALRFAFWSRMDRTEEHAARLRAAVRIHPGMTLWDGLTQVDLQTGTGRMLVGVKSAESAGAAITLKEATFVGSINKLTTGKWDRSESVLPFGYRFTRRVLKSGEIQRDRGIVEYDSASKPVLTELVTMAADGKTWNAIGQRAAELQIPLRSARFARTGRTFAEIGEGSAVGTAAKNLIGNPAHIELWRTGEWTVRRYCGLQGVTSLRGDAYPLEFEPGELNGYIDTRIEWAAPEPAWGIDDEIWDRLEARIAREADSAGQRKGKAGLASSDATRRPLSAVPGWDAGDGFEYRFAPATDTAYRLRRRNESDGTTAEGRVRGWRTGEGEAIATFHSASVHSSVSFALEEALVRTAGDGAEIASLPTAPRVIERNGKVSASKSEVLLAQAARDDTDADAFDDMALSAHKGGNKRSAQTFIDKAEAARVNAEQNRELAAALQRADDEQAGDAEEEPEVTLDLSSPAVVAGALRRFDRTAPAALADAVAALGITDTFRIRLSEDRAIGHWAATCDIPVVGGEPVCVEISGEIPNSRPEKGAANGSTRGHTDDLVRQLLHEGRSMEQVCRTYNRGEEWVTARAVGWLRDRGVTARSLPSVILDCPIPETRRVVYAVASDRLELAADLAPAFVAHITATYFTDGGWGNPCWTPANWRFERRLISTLLAADDCQATKMDLAEAFGISMRQMAIRVRVRSDTGRRVVERVGSAMMRPVPCPHSDCAGLGQGGATGARPAWASHILVTPETGGGLLCPACRRAPENDLVVFPAAYLKLWEGPHDAFGTTRGVVVDGKTTLAETTAVPVELAESGAKLTVKKTAEALGWSEWRVRSELEPDAVSGGVRLYDRSRIDRLAISEGRVRAESFEHTARWVTAGEAAAMLGVPEWLIRSRADKGGIVHKRHPRTGHRLIERAGVEALRAELTVEATPGLVGIYEAARLAGVTRNVLRTAADNGQVECLRTTGGSRRFTAEAIAAYRDEHGDHMASGTAAAILGLDKETFRKLWENGKILPATITAGGHRRWARTDIELLKGTR